jgi:hypothetical protein
MEATLAGTKILVKGVKLKALAPMLVTVSGTVIWLSLGQLENARLPMVVKPSDNRTLVRLHAKGFDPEVGDAAGNRNRGHLTIGKSRTPDAGYGKAVGAVGNDHHGICAIVTGDGDRAVVGGK